MSKVIQTDVGFAFQRSVTLTSGLFLHRRHHQDYIWSERSTTLHSYLLYLEEKNKYVQLLSC